jgi:hypothetical protein
VESFRYLGGNWWFLVNGIPFHLLKKQTITPKDKAKEGIKKENGDSNAIL